MSRGLRTLPALLLVAGLATAGCGVRHIEPPAAPPPVLPEIPEVPPTAPAEGMGRLLIETEGEPAKVTRVTETTEGVAMGYPGPGTDGITIGEPGVARKTELLCITPCAVDLKTGAQTLVFTSTKEPVKTSSADVAVPRGTTVVRHALGREKPYNVPYVTAVILTFTGTALTLMGGLALGIGLTVDPTLTENGKPTSDPTAFTTFGAVLGTAGLVALATGIVLMVSNQPEKRPGATTTFRVAP